jgi:hypothetical protein
MCCRLIKLRFWAHATVAVVPGRNASMKRSIIGSFTNVPQASHMCWPSKAHRPQATRTVTPSAGTRQTGGGRGQRTIHPRVWDVIEALDSPDESSDDRQLVGADSRMVPLRKPNARCYGRAPVVCRASDCIRWMGSARDKREPYDDVSLHGVDVGDG